MEQLHRNRIDEARRATDVIGADALVVSSLPNVFYLTGFTGSNGWAVVLPDSLHLFTDGRYTQQAREEALQARVHIVKQPLPEACGVFLQARVRKSPIRAALDPAHVNLSEWKRLRAAAGKKVRWRTAGGLVEGLREIKAPAELETMRHAAKLGSDVMAEVIEWIRPGITELDVAAEIDFRIRRKGASGPSFDTIVASGPRSALPHARPTAKRLQKRELVVLDLGAILGHYCSDLTRTIHLGRAPARVRKLYRSVEQAQQAALAALSAGCTAGIVDGAARGVLDRCGLGRYFTHSTGHGLGIEVHEPPRLGRGQKQEIRAGSVVTLEPGIYVEGLGGIRIEDDVAVHAGGTEVLTSAPRGLLEI